MKFSARNTGPLAALVTALGIFAGVSAAQAQQEIKIGYALAPTSHYGVAARNGRKWSRRTLTGAIPSVTSPPPASAANAR